MTILDHRAESLRDVPAKSPVIWKLIVAVEAPWTGEMYRTRPGGERTRFTSVETFCAALLAITEWPLQAQADAQARNRTAGAGRRRRRDDPWRSGKFIVAADHVWTGEVYRTRPGLGHLHFGSFEQFLGAVLELTGWSLDGRPSSGYGAPGESLSRPA